MKTDRFSDSIRRKLESIRPDFSEKDWARMQATLLKHPITPPSGSPTAGSPTPFQPVATSMWSAQPWLMAAAAASTVVLLSVAIWQQKQINQLHQTVSQLSRQRTATQPNPATHETITPDAVALPADQQTARRTEIQPGALNQPGPADRSIGATDSKKMSSGRPDTVYVTRYVPVPAAPASGMPERTAQRSAYANRPASDNQPERLNEADGAPIAADRPLKKRLSNQPGNAGQHTDVDGVAVTDDASPVVSEATNAVPAESTRRSESANAPTRRTTDRTTGQPVVTRSENLAGGRRKRSTSALSTMPTTNPSGSNDVVTTETTDLKDVASTSTATTEPTASYELATSQPLTMDTKDWSKSLAYRARALRPARTTVVGGTAAPESPASQPVRQMAIGFRVGVGTDISQNLLTGHILTELLLGNHLTLGIGLGKASFAGGKFLTDHDFDRDMRQNFRHNFARGLDPRNDIINIGIRTERVQLPISLGYRIPVSQTISIVPSVGTILNLQSTQFVNFFYREPFQGFEESRHKEDVAVNLLSNLTFGANVEWKRRHWIGQAGPLLTTPTFADAGWKQGQSLGLRARVFYQF